VDWTSLSQRSVKMKVEVMDVEFLQKVEYLHELRDYRFVV
jgi:hypothetical protein